MVKFNDAAFAYEIKFIVWKIFNFRFAISNPFYLKQNKSLFYWALKSIFICISGAHDMHHDTQKMSFTFIFGWF